MMTPSSRRPARLCPLALVLVLLAAALPRAGAAVEESAAPSPYAPIVAHAEAMVTVRFVLRIKMEGAGERELEGEIDCLAIDAADTILCSNTELGGYVTIMGRMIGGGMNLSATPTDVRVSRRDDPEGRPARLVTRDTDRDLAWLQIEPDAGGEGTAAAGQTPAEPFLDLSQSTALAAGERFYALRRMGKFFRDTPVVVEGTVGAVTRRPRRLFVPSAPLGIGFGQPVFTADGTLVGVTVMQAADAGEAQRLLSNPMSFLSTAAKLGDMVGGLILPADEIARATELMREILAEDETAKSAADGPER